MSGTWTIPCDQTEIRAYTSRETHIAKLSVLTQVPDHTKGRLDYKASYELSTCQKLGDFLH
jgi:hypothetical protein